MECPATRQLVERMNAAGLAVTVGSSAQRKELEPLLPAERRAEATLLEIVPEGSFLTYGIGVPLMKMRNPEEARGRVPVEREAA